MSKFILFEDNCRLLVLKVKIKAPSLLYSDYQNLVVLYTCKLQSSLPAGELKGGEIRVTDTKHMQRMTNYAHQQSKGNKHNCVLLFNTALSRSLKSQEREGGG